MVEMVVLQVHVHVHKIQVLQEVQEVEEEILLEILEQVILRQ